MKPEKKEVYNKKEVGKCYTHAIASNQHYGYNQAIDDYEAWLPDLKEIQLIWEGHI